MDKYNSILLGTVIGILTALLSIVVFYFIKYEAKGFLDYFSMLFTNKKLFAPLISLAGIPNLIVFYFFINRNKYKTARGIILATFVLVIIVGIIKIFG